MAGGCLVVIGQKQTPQPLLEPGGPSAPGPCWLRGDSGDSSRKLGRGFSCRVQGPPLIKRPLRHPWCVSTSRPSHLLFPLPATPFLKFPTWLMSCPPSGLCPMSPDTSRCDRSPRIAPHHNFPGAFSALLFSAALTLPDICM